MRDAISNSAIEFRVAERLRKYRLEKGISQKDLAERMGVFRQNLCSWEHEVTRPNSIAVWVKWANALGLDYLEELEKAINHRHDSDAGEP